MHAHISGMPPASQAAHSISVTLAWLLQFWPESIHMLPATSGSAVPTVMLTALILSTYIWAGR